MSVLSISPRKDNPVTNKDLDGVCESLGIHLKHGERDDYRKLLATFHESAAELMDMPGIVSPKSRRCNPCN